MSLSICGGRRNETERRTVVRYCPKCKRRRRMSAWFEEWYGWTAICKAKKIGKNGVTYTCWQMFGSES